MKIEVDTIEAVNVDKVFLDGVQQFLATSLDTEEGWVVRYKTNEQGNILLGGPTEKVYGKVEVQFREVNK